MNKIKNLFVFSWMYRLRNSGFTAAIQIIVMTLNHYRDEINHDYFLEKLDKLIELLPEVAKIKHHSRKDDATVILEGYRQTRFHIISEIRSNLKDSMRSRYSELSEPGAMLYEWFNSRVPRVHESAQFEISGYISTISDDLEQDSKIVEAVTSLDMMMWFRDLIEVEQLYQELYINRGIKAVEKTDAFVDAVAIRAEVMKAIRSLLGVMRDFTESNVFEEYKPMLTALQKNLEPFRTTVKRRQNARKSEIISDESSNSSNNPNSEVDSNNQESDSSNDNESNSVDTSTEGSTETKYA